MMSTIAETNPDAKPAKIVATRL